MSGKKKIYRLFKVAKELNVGTSALVDHLQANGHEVAASPNTKLSEAQYNVLLKEFADEKMIKEEAAQLIDKQRREDVRSENGEGTPPKREDDFGNDGITAADLRDQISGKTKPEPEPKAEPEPKPEPKPVAKPVAEAPPKPPVEEVIPPKPDPTPTPPPPPPTPVQEKPVEPEATKTPSNGLKVVGKIDIGQFGKDRKKTQSSKPASKKPPVQEQPVKESAPPKVEPPQQKQTPPPPVKTKGESKPEVSKTPPPVKEPVAQVDKPSEKKPEVSEKQPPVEKAPVSKAAPETPVKQEATATPTPVSLDQPETIKNTTTPAAPVAEKEASEEPEKKGVVRAEDHTPKLSGLKVMGKIELPGDKKKKKEEPAKSTADKEESDDDKPKKRRRRRRKRKSKDDKGTATPGQTVSQEKSGTTSTANSRNRRKEKPSEKEVDQSIKNTLNQIGRSTSRNRQRLRRDKRDAAAARREALEARAAEDAMTLELTEFITANEFANLINVPINEIITKSFELGMMISINQRLDAELLTLLAGDYGYSAEFVDVTEAESDFEEVEDNEDDLKPRAPIITVMGHVDHGKTTLLDRLRQANVAAGEAGGITQHIGAYTVNLQNGQKVTFLDTPGHEAFTAMRARGAKVTDVAIIVIAADDAVMPQTKEAISHAQAAEVPMVFALNKIDKAGANSDRIRTQLAEMDLLVEDWGGKYQSQEISALKGDQVEELLEKVIFESELLELKANPDRLAAGTVIESRLDKGRGTVVTMLVEKGTLKIGDPLIAGIHYGKVRALIDQNGKRVEEATPATPVQVLGVNGQPTAGDKFYAFEDEGKAKEISQRRSELYRQQQLRNTNRLTLEEIGRRRALGNFKELNVIIRGDVDGSVEALAGSLLKLSTEEVQVNIVQKAVGAITEADVNLAIASEAIVIAFNVRPIAKARQLADRESVDIQFYSVIYDAINDVRDALEGLLSPELRQEITGTAEIKEVFKISKVGNIAGCLVTTGKIERNNPVRIIRDGVVVHESKLASLKRFKDDVKEALSGQECGMMIENYNDIKVGDEIESYRVNEVRRKL